MYNLFIFKGQFIVLYILAVFHQYDNTQYIKINNDKLN